MSKLILIADATGNYWINPDNVVTVTEDIEGKFECVVYTTSPDVTIRLRMSVGEVLRLLNC